ncbi:AMSH-like protease sst2 [Grifola frondosa]|uniref:AMSH-like protease sst2 n=1 Tax=Grifola frondosa TaxID=5627 RepID=A0A1C7MH76_GRIFR|nr:AMSH-like protease sst2 [Grifola frondosa]
MSATVYPSHSRTVPGFNSGPSNNYRPATIAELAAQAQDNLWDPSKGLKHWLRTAEKARRTAEAYVEARNFERAFVEYAKAATIVLEKLPSHPEYQTLLNADQRHNLGMNGQDILDSLSQLKPMLVERYEQWQAQEKNSPLPSRPSTAGSELSAQETGLRRRDEQLRTQEQERASQALEAARREEEWKRDELSRRVAEERDRNSREEAAWYRQMQAKRREEAAAAADARRAAEALDLAERERAVHDEEERSRRKAAADEKRRQEQEGIVRRQQEAEAAARAVRQDIVTRLSPVPPAASSSRRTADQEANARDISARSVHAPQPSRPSNTAPYGTSNGLSIMPLESPSRYDDDSSTDVEGLDRKMSWNRQRHTETPTKTRHPGVSYPPPITTTSPAPPELGPIRYPSLMSQHQLKQGYVPSLQSMFSETSKPPAPDSSLLFESKASSGLYSNILPQPSTPVIPPYPSQMPVPEPHGSYSHPQTGYRGPSPSGARPPPHPPKEALYGRVSNPPPSSSSAASSRVIPGGSNDSSVRDLRTVKLPRECLQKFLSIARVNTLQNRETCGLLLGKDKGSKYVVTTLLIPKQHSTSDTCTMDEEELVLQFTEERHLITLGWIHTHPTQSCFMSSVDLHTHSGFQRMLPESFAVVCAPSSTPTFGIFRLTDPPGLQTILQCKAKEAFHPILIHLYTRTATIAMCK